ncbi:MAG: hypothetical protein JO033_28840 [Acidobacteriaceae bacterium]|nr:hypothetical protein [Acidobacteriaceae bacterium]MBV9503041.1 hypothetical protein [Acidobacteriaceae bacterium]
MTNVNLPIPFRDALQEFSVETSTLPARYGLRTAGVVNAITKSGTNAFHGELFEFLRNGDLNARNTFAATPDTLKRNQFRRHYRRQNYPRQAVLLYWLPGYEATQRPAPDH